MVDKFDLKTPNRNIALANLSIYYTWKNIKSEYNNDKFKISAPTWNDLLIYLMVLILLMIFRIILNTLLKQHETLNEDLPIEIYPNKIKNRIVFKIKTPIN